MAKINYRIHTDAIKVNPIFSFIRVRNALREDITQSVFGEEKMKDRCVGCSLYNVQKPDRWEYIEGYEEQYRISAKEEVQHWENNKIEIKLVIVLRT